VRSPDRTNAPARRRSSLDCARDDPEPVEGSGRPEQRRRARREIPLGWPPADSMPLTGNLLARTVPRLERTETFRIAEGIFIRPVTVAVKGFACRADRALDRRTNSWVISRPHSADFDRPPSRMHWRGKDVASLFRRGRTAWATALELSGALATGPDLSAAHRFLPSEHAL
jgi:hypothetical protein